MEVYDRYEHAGVIVEIVRDDDPRYADPMENDNAGTIYSWTREFAGDQQISEPENVLYSEDEQTGEEVERECSPEEYMAAQYDAALTIPLRFEDQRYGARIYKSDDPNCALVFTQKEIDEEWKGHLDAHPVEMKDANGNLTGEVREYGGAREYAKARINELDLYFQGHVYGIVIRERDGFEEGEGEVLGSVWGFIADPFEKDSWIVEQTNEMAEACAEAIEKERQEREYWMARDVITV